MKFLSAVLGVCVLALLSLWFFQRNQSAELQAQVASLTNDRASTERELKRLSEHVAELSRAKERSASPTSATAPAPSSASAATAPAAGPAPRPGVTVAAPAGWPRNGAKADQYVVGVDANQTWGGMPSAYVESVTPEVDGGFGGMMQTISAENYVGKRVRLSGWIKTEDANQGGGHLWLRIDGQERGQMLGFDNMSNRAVKGTSDWQEASIVLDVPPGSRALAYGFFVAGGGKMWVNGQRIEEVGTNVPTTEMKPPQRTLPGAPQNLGFDPNRPK